MTSIDWTTQLVDQLTWHWDHQLRPRLDGLTDDEYRWEPAPDCWNVRPRGTGTAAVAAGSGAYTIDFAFPEPDPVPVTTVSWRLAHVIVGVFGLRNTSHFGGPPIDYETFDYAGSAGQALDQLDEGYRRWIAGVRGLDADGLAQPCGPAEGPFSEYPMAALVLHIHREVIHHGAEISLLRDLYRHRVAP
ncbi:MAG: DinB family protein [Actinocatenispora sp.]